MKDSFASAIDEHSGVQVNRASSGLTGETGSRMSNPQIDASNLPDGNSDIGIDGGNEHADG